MERERERERERENTQVQELCKNCNKYENCNTPEKR